MFYRMKIAEALVLRADLAKRLDQLKLRAVRVAKVQDGDTPAEDPDALLAEYEETAQSLLVLITRINLTNAATMLGGRTLTAALAERDVLRLRQVMHQDLAKAAAITQTVSTRSEVRFRPTIAVSAVQRKADDLSRALRNLDTKVQEVNWLTTLQE